MSLHTFTTNNQINSGRVFFGNATPAAVDGNTYIIGDFIQFLPFPAGSAVTQSAPPYGWYCTLGGAGGTATWIAVAQGVSVLMTENGAANAIATAAGSGPPLATGLTVQVQLAHTLQIGANTFAYNAGSALAIKSHFNVATNIATGYAATGVIVLYYNGTLWLDLSQ